MSETIDTLNQRVSIRQYTDDPLNDDTVLRILNAARRSATSSNHQAYSFVVVRNPATKARLAELAGNQQHIIQCPVFVAVCADVSRLQRAAQIHDTTLAINLELSMVAIVDAAIVGQSAAVAAESLGLGTVMIGGMRNHPREVCEVLGLPEGVFVVYGLCLGYPAESPAQKPRFAEEVMIHFERYTPATDTQLNEYDADLAGHYRAQGRKSPDDAWTGIIARRFNVPPRPHLRDTLEEQGYRFE